METNKVILSNGKIGHYDAGSGADEILYKGKFRPIFEDMEGCLYFTYKKIYIYIIGDVLTADNGDELYCHYWNGDDMDMLLKQIRPYLSGRWEHTAISYHVYKGIYFRRVDGLDIALFDVEEQENLTEYFNIDTPLDEIHQFIDEYIDNKDKLNPIRELIQNEGLKSVYANLVQSKSLDDFISYLTTDLEQINRALEIIKIQYPNLIKTK